MNADNKRTKIIEKVKALLARTTDNGCTEAEAMTAARKVGDLLAEHNLSMSEVDIREEAQHCETDYLDTGATQKNPGEVMLWGIDAFFDVKTWVNRASVGRKTLSVRYAFFGMPADVAAAKYLTAILFETMEREAKAYLKSYGGGRTAGASFREAFGNRIRTRLIQMTRERDERRAAGTTGTAVVELKGQLVEQKYRDLNMKLAAARTSTRQVDFGAAAAGAAAGSRASLHQGIESAATATRAIAAR